MLELLNSLTWPAVALLAVLAVCVAPSLFVMTCGLFGYEFKWWR